MNESLTLAGPLHAYASDPEVHQDIGEFAPELLALRDARKRAFDERVAAENALREAQAAEAELRAQEEEALAAAAARREEAMYRREREAQERVAQLESRLHQAAVAIEQTQIASNAASLARDEAQRTLEALGARCAELHESLRAATADRRGLEAELSAARHEAAASTLAREKATLSAAVVPPSPEPSSPNVAVLSNRTEELQQRAAERRAADALRSRAG